MRPVLTKWLGILLVFLFVVVFLGSIRSDFMRAAEVARDAFERTSKNGQLNFGFWDSCLRSSECMRGFVVSWSAPLMVKALVLGGLVFGTLCALLGSLWRPEVIAMRDTRVNAVRVEESRLKSPTVPRGLL